MNNFNAYSLLVTENCNLACKYCYEKNSTGHKNNNMTKETAIKSVEFMFDQAIESGEKRVNISFFGGEPTLMPDIIDTACETGKKLATEHKKNFSVGMITNATNMNEKLYNVLHKHIDIWGSTQLSIDGPHEIQDQYRITRKGAGSFSLIEKNMPYWKALYDNRKLNIHGVLNPDSMGKLFESFLFFREEWGVERLWFLPAKADWTNNHVKLYDEQLGKIYDYVMAATRKNNNLDEIGFYAPLDRALRDGRQNKPCGAGNNYCTITADGGIWPCHHFYFIDKKKELYLGNVFDGVDNNKKKIWIDYDASDMVGCEDCDHPSCYRCMAENYEKFGSPFVQIRDKHCEFMKIDLKYQRKIKSEVIEMGLIKKKDNTDTGQDCLGQKRDCVGKQGECPVVTSIDECVFDRKDGVKETPPAFDQVEEKKACQCAEKKTIECSDNDTDTDHGRTIIKEILDDIIKILVKYHNKL